MWFFKKRKPRQVTLTEIERHQAALRYFIKNETSMGCYGGGGELHATNEAMYFFAYENFVPEVKGEQNENSLS